MNQRLVVAVLVVRGKLQVVVEEEPQIVAPAGDDDALVGRGFGVDDFVGVEVRFGQRGQLPGPGETEQAAPKTAQLWVASQRRPAVGHETDAAPRAPRLH
jgi:hypothetical protein